MKIKLKHLGFIIVDEVYQGEDTVDWVITDQQARNLAKLILLTSEERDRFNFKLGLQPGKDEAYALTVSSSGHEANAPVPYPAAGQLDFLTEGYRVGWSNRGLEIQTTDYHAGTLVVPWELVLELACASNRP